MKGLAATRARIHELVSDCGLTLADPLIRQETEDALTDAETPEAAEPTYVLRSMGDVDLGDQNLISGPVIMRRHRFRLMLSCFAGFDLETVAEELSALAQECVDVLEDPQNQNRTTTGWLWAGSFVVGPHDVVQGRLACTVDFDVRYDHEVSAL